MIWYGMVWYGMVWCGMTDNRTWAMVLRGWGMKHQSLPCLRLRASYNSHDSSLAFEGLLTRGELGIHLCFYSQGG